MDKRSLMAIALTFVILIGWQAFFVAPQQKKLAAKRAMELREKERADSLAAIERGVAEEETLAVSGLSDTLGAAPSATSSAAPAGTSAFLLPGGDTIRAARVTVVTEKMKVVLSSVGGEVESVTFASFKRKDGSLVELVPAGAEGGLSLALQRNGEWKTLAGLGFEAFVDGAPVADSARVVLGEGRETAEILFKRQGPSGEYVEKRLTFSRGGYSVGVRIALKREGEMASSGAYSIGWESGLATSEANVKLEQTKFAALGMVGAEYYQSSLGKFSKETRRTYDGTVVWAGARTKYFLSALVASKENRGSGTLVLLGERDKGFVGYAIAYPFRGDPREIEDSFTWYAGPLDMKSLKAFGVGLEKTIDLGRLRFLSVGILWLMVWVERFIPNYGVVIIILSLLTKFLFYRLTHKSLKAMKDMQRIQPKLKEIQEKYKGDRDRQNKEVMKLYKEAGVNPLGGCLPLLLQMPVFFALYSVLSNTIELRNAPFVSWINDLSAPDALFRWKQSIPMIGSEFHLLPILMGVAMIYQSKLSGSPTGDTVPAAQTKMMTYLMPVIMTVFFYTMPSGLVLYWLVNNVAQIVQQYFVQKELDAEEATRLAAQ
ncbi:MAG: membrane protein insertase YidC [Candidatus Krumholzibacteria bacterium]|nr:membrane protein insertase YidC [Candidatus Krumholzibacteria bacterium]